ncbi:hypothetical protein DMUE_4003 [Dictyocoela muelleri]|nr:hypothetical protein DMUE_4003 [Dictyocoela muelleri]
MINLKKLIACSCLSLIFLAVDTICYSSLPIKIGKKSYTELNMLLYIFSSFISQISCNLCSKMKTACITGPIVVNFTNFEFLIKNITKTIELRSENAIITNTMACMFITSFLFAISSIILSKANGERILKNIPKSAITGALAYIGYNYIFVSLRDCSKNLIRFVAFCSSLAMFIFKRVTNSPFAIIFAVFSLCFIFHTLKFFILELKNTEWILTSKNVILSPKTIYQYFEFRFIDYKVILKNFHHILSIVGFSHMHFFIKYPLFAQETGIDILYNSEILVQGIMNLFSSSICMPTYFFYGYSLMINRIGCQKQLYGIIIAIQYPFLILFISFIKNYVPNFVVPSLNILLGMEMIVSAIEKVYNSNLIDFLTIFITFIAIFISDLPICGIVFGVLFNYLAIYLSNRYKRSKEV